MKTMDNPLTRHFQSLDDIRYISLKKLFKKTVEELTVANNCIKQFLLCEQASDVLEYLIVFCKNIIRMGFSEVFPGVEEELATLYDAEENVNRILAEAVASIRSESIDLGSRTLFIDKFENASDDRPYRLRLQYRRRSGDGSSAPRRRGRGRGCDRVRTGGECRPFAAHPSEERAAVSL